MSCSDVMLRFTLDGCKEIAHDCLIWRPVADVEEALPVGRAADLCKLVIYSILAVVFWMAWWLQSRNIFLQRVLAGVLHSGSPQLNLPWTRMRL